MASIDPHSLHHKLLLSGKDNYHQHMHTNKVSAKAVFLVLTSSKSMTMHGRLDKLQITGNGVKIGDKVIQAPFYSP